MTTTAKPNPRSLPRKKRTPSARDQAIFLAYRTQGHTQEQLATDNRLSQSRIGQILRRVARWSANLAPRGAGIPACHTSSPLSPPELRRLEWLLCRERSQSLFDRSIRAFDREKSALKTTRAGHRDHKPYQETVTREVNTSSQLLRVAQKANADLQKLAMSEPPPQPNPEADEALLERLMFERLYQKRENAEDENKVAKSTEGLESFQVVDHWYAALIGDQSNFPIHPADLAPTEPLGQLAQFFCEPSIHSGAGIPACHVPSWEGEAPAEPTPSEISDLKSQIPSPPKTENRKPKTPSNPPNPASPNPIPTPFASTTSSPPPPLTPSSSCPTPTRSVSEGSSPKTENRKPKTPAISPAARRLEHQHKLEQLAEYRRRGLPCMFTFDPADGPLPPTSHPHDYHIVEPGPY